jgi:hypothetical protein
VKKRLPLLIDKYDPNDVCNADKTGVFFKHLSDCSLAIAKETDIQGRQTVEKAFHRSYLHPHGRHIQVTAASYR